MTSDSGLPSSKPPVSKLFIRSEVLAVIEVLTSAEPPPKQEKVKQIKRLQSIDDRAVVLNILVKELVRTHDQIALHTVAELLMELGEIGQLQDPLWDLIKQPDTRDEVKDAANLILRHLGDESDPELYLEYLDDPVGLISRETERMLAVSAQNPEALIDFIDFIFSLPAEEQMNLVSSLHADYQPEYLVNLYIPMLLADPLAEVTPMLLSYLGETRSAKAARFLQEHKERFEDSTECLRVIRKSLNELKLAGVVKELPEDDYPDEDFPEDFASTPSLSIKDLCRYNEPEAGEAPDGMVTESQFYHCFATLPDGIGNQGLMISRQRDNGDVIMISVALNDLHGVIDCFGFYQLSEEDFGRIANKFHETTSKIEVSPEYCLFKLTVSEGLNRIRKSRIPYEYTCWKGILDDVSVPKAQQIDVFAFCNDHTEPGWASMTGSLYQHPDLKTWFMEEDDHPAAAAVFERLYQWFNLLNHAADPQAEAANASPAEEVSLDILPDLNQLTLQTFAHQLEDFGIRLVESLMATSWLGFMIQRLADSAYLFECQQTHSFARLAATEVQSLINLDRKIAAGQEDAVVITDFLRQYGRHCMAEALLRYTQQGPVTEQLQLWTQELIQLWEKPLDLEEVSAIASAPGSSV